MARPVRPWFRFYVEAFGDRKLRRLKPEYRWLFAACLGAARQSPMPGVLLVAEGHPMDIRDLADYAGMDIRAVRAGLAQLIRMGLIVEDQGWDNARYKDLIAYRSPTFQTRQFESDDVTKRTRKHRLTSADASEGTFQPSSQERSGNAGGNAPETETETETEKSRAAAPKRAHQLPADFEPNDTNQRLANERGLDLAEVVAQFSDHHRSKGSTYIDWHLALNTWLRREKPANGSNVVHLPDGRVKLPPLPKSFWDQ